MMGRGAAVVAAAALLVIAGAAQAEPPPATQPSATQPSATQPSPAPASQPSASQPSPAPASQRSDPREVLRTALDLYVAGRYRAAAELLRPLVERRELADRADHREALRAYGISLFLSGARAGAGRAFRALLRVKPDARLDPSFVRPEVVAFFDDVRRRYRAEMDSVVRRSAPSGSALLNLLPPWGQFQNGHRLKGFLLLGGELVTIATCITTGALLYSWRGETKEFIGHKAAARPLDVTNKVSFALALGLIAYGIIDGLYYYFRRRKARLQRSDRALGPGFTAAAVGSAAGATLLRF